MTRGAISELLFVPWQFDVIPAPQFVDWPYANAGQSTPSCDQQRIALLRAANLLGEDMVGADHVAPALDLALEQGGRGFGRLLVGRDSVHAAIRVNVFFTLGSASASRSAALSLSTIGRGVPAGANSMCQKSRSSFL